MKKLLILVPILSLVASPVHAEVWPDGPYTNYSTYWENKGISALVVRDIWKYADVMGFDKGQFDRSVQAALQIETLTDQNSNLQNKINDLETRVRDLESRPTSAPGGNTTVIQNVDNAKIDDLDHRVRVLEGVISMMEVNIGSLYARMDQLLAPVLKKLGL